MISEIDVIAHRSFDASQFMMQEGISNHPGSNCQRKSSSNQNRATLLLECKPNPEHGHSGKKQNNRARESNETEGETREQKVESSRFFNGFEKKENRDEQKNEEWIFGAKTKGINEEQRISGDDPCRNTRGAFGPLP